MSLANADPAGSLARGIVELARDQFQVVWKRARPGVVPGPEVVVGVSHPDIEKAWNELPAPTQSFLRVLTALRVELFQGLRREERQHLLKVGTGAEALDGALKERIAKLLHDQWWFLRKLLGMDVAKPHVGDIPWEEQTEAARDGDRAMVQPWCELLAGYEKSSSPEHRAVIEYIMA